MKKYKRVLLIDDDEACLFLHQLLIEEMDLSLQIDCVKNGLEALKYINLHYTPERNKDVDYPPTLLLLDINMPVMDGFEFLERCQGISYLEERAIRVVLLTSSSATADRSKAHQYGIKQYLTKLLTKEMLEKLLAE
jgi:CheY-like chemotaxis protein